MTNGSSENDEDKEGKGRSPAGIKAEAEYTGKFVKILHRQSQITAERRGSKELSDSDYHEAYRYLIQIKNRKINIFGAFLSASGIALIVSGFTLSGLTSTVIGIHVVFGGLVSIGGYYIQNQS